MQYNARRALELLRLGAKQPAAQFREGQEDAIRHIVEGRGRLLVVQKTGWGKSFVYFIANRLMREAGGGPALLVSPLLSLMRNQIESAARMGVQAATIHSGNSDEWDEVEAKLNNDQVDILLISPERFANEAFARGILPGIANRIALLIIDEVHCISDWGHDFRPDYRRIGRLIKTLPGNVRLLGTTATANNRVMEDLQHVFGAELTVLRGNLHRPSLLLQSIRMPSATHRLAWLAEHIPQIPGSGIIYALTVRDAERAAAWLQTQGLTVNPYTGAMQTEERVLLERALINNEVKALVATTALGMGFDKPDLGFVIHYQAPGSVVAYYQQVGRAGRGVTAAYGVLLSGGEEMEITNYFIENAFPNKGEVERVIAALQNSPEGLSINGLTAALNIRRGRIEHALKLLALESPAPVVKQRAKWRLTASTMGGELWERAERLTAIRRMEQQQMQAYVKLQSGHMEFLVAALDGHPQTTRPPNLQPLPATVNPQLADKALAFLRGRDCTIAARKRWHTGKPIPPEHRMEKGKALCHWGDPGWGELVQHAKYRGGAYPDQLAAASVALMRNWNPTPAPTWVTCIPSARNTRVQAFAEQLAEALRLPFRPILRKSELRPPQKGMANSAQQAQNVLDSFGIGDDITPEPVLLVDDIVDSRWTMTVAACLLRSHGCGKVWPFALADAGTSA